VPTNTNTSLTVHCPDPLRAVGGYAYWASSSAAIQTFLVDYGVAAYTEGVPGVEIMRVQAICADVDFIDPESMRSAPADKR